MAFAKCERLVAQVWLRDACRFGAFCVVVGVLLFVGGGAGLCDEGVERIWSGAAPFRGFCQKKSRRCVRLLSAFVGCRCSDGLPQGALTSMR
ncbi:hypothetical protein TPADAL_0067a [Treponema pallidum subsp. pallidum DAL-1]|nr:hypothetical protein TPESAMD_0067a [Treponema pallidum subsp. pertenue str. SamoaD]AEZ58252.1 hypothetical protein TPECDC2_0067a [Treponema pallidum subsp. pertenue str. CDC2]AEZ59320.1 hypothetical protein TPEGAU_0067a [Treponema pallidum subsp. pertenue str. Gauthier]AEZ60385.1 hypothetical protein TPADAL_0067a [Treponema pallidum subsp. pallidum DAL-1]AGK83708.1 hypothetical protein TPFB_0067a [Treponema pallidum str. Fribourg-Blanc]ASV57713.1 hypothetical protein TPEGhana051_0067a [Trep